MITKKIILILTIIFTASLSFAQVDMFNGTLKEAIEKAKNENKYVAVVASATWCDPCKYLTDKIFATKKTGDYINPRLVVLKYFLDKADPDQILTRYKIAAYPTIIIIDHNGDEINRKLGGGVSDDVFLKALEKTLDPNNMYPAWEERLKKDPSTATDYIQYLINDCRMGGRANDIIYNTLDNRVEKSFLSQKALNTYAKIADYKESKVIEIFVKKGKEIASVIGEKEYSDYMKKIGRSLVNKNMSGRNKNYDKASEVLEFINSNKALSSDYTTFLTKNINIFKAGDPEKLAKTIKKSIKNVDSTSRRSIILSYFSYVDDDYIRDNLDSAIGLYETALKHGKDEAEIKAHNGRITYLKNIYKK